MLDFFAGRTDIIQLYSNLYLFISFIYTAPRDFFMPAREVVQSARHPPLAFSHALFQSAPPNFPTQISKFSTPSNPNVFSLHKPKLFDSGAVTAMSSLQSRKTQPIICRPRTQSPAPRRPGATQPVRPLTSIPDDPTPITSYLNDLDCVSLRQKVLDSTEAFNFAEIELDLLTHFLIHLKEYERQCAFKEDYREAAVARSLAGDVKGEIAGRNCGETDRELNTECTEKSDQFEKEWEDKIAAYCEETDQKREQLLTLQKQQLDRFEKNWSENQPSKYRKPSSQLLQLKYLEHCLGLAGDYDRAEQVHAEAEALTQSEMGKAQSALVTDYRNARLRVEQRQRSDIEQFEAIREDGLKLLRANRETEKQKIDRRQFVLAVQKNNAAKRESERTRRGFSEPSPPLNSRIAKQNLLPPLIPPNDPDFVAEEEQKAREENRRKLRRQRERREELIRKYKESMLSPPPEPAQGPTDRGSPKAGVGSNAVGAIAEGTQGADEETTAGPTESRSSVGVQVKKRRSTGGQSGSITSENPEAVESGELTRAEEGNPETTTVESEASVPTEEKNPETVVAESGSPAPTEEKDAGTIPELNAVVEEAQAKLVEQATGPSESEGGGTGDTTAAEAKERLSEEAPTDENGEARRSEISQTVELVQTVETSVPGGERSSVDEPGVPELAEVPEEPRPAADQKNDEAHPEQSETATPATAPLGDIISDVLTEGGT
jgi:hypothetical protein